MRRPIGAGVVLVALLVMSGRPSRAGDPRLDAARAHSQEGDAYYKLEKYANAISEYEQAYLAKPDPSFLYNIAQCHRLMGQGPEAVKFYRRYLKDAPNAPNRAVAEKHIRDLEGSSAHGTQPPPAPVPAPSPTSSAPSPTEPSPVTPLATTPTSAPGALSPPAPTSTPVSTTPVVETGNASSESESKPIYHKWWFWAGVGGAAVVGGIIIFAATRHDPSCRAGYTCQ